MSRQTVASLPLQIAVPLAAAFVQAVADAVGTRVLFIKGPAASVQGVRKRESSSDIDALVDPTAFERLTDALAERGWRARFVPADDFYTLPFHSVTLVHPDWPCDLDLHLYFIGTFSPPQLTFEMLWQDRESHVIGGKSVTTPSVIGQRLILSLNALRGTGNPQADIEAGQLAQHFAAHPEDWEAQIELASTTRSLSALREFAAAHDLPQPAGDLSTAEMRQLDVVVRYHHNSLGNLTYRLGSPDLTPRKKLRVLWHFLFKSTATLRREDPSFTGGALTALRANAARWRSGFAQWREARRTPGVRNSETVPRTAGPGREFRIEQALPAAPIAALRATEDGSAVLLNSPVPRTEVRSRRAEPSQRFTVDECGSNLRGSTLFILPLSEAVLQRYPDRTPDVLRLDLSGQELLELLREQPRSSSDLSAEIGARHSLAPEEIENSVLAFVQQLFDAGAIRPVED